MASRVLLVGTIVTVSASYLLARHWHSSLEYQISSTSVTANDRSRSHASGEIESLPNDIIEHPDQYRLVHEKDVIAVPISIPPNDNKASELFTKLLRRNMSCFTRFPQMWLLSLVVKSPERKASFSQSHIRALDFQPGDLFCGFYRVTKRDPSKVEVRSDSIRELPIPPTILVISLQHNEGKVFLETDTVQWTVVGDPKVLPMEGKVTKFLHEMASWWLLVSGARYLQSLTMS